MITQYINFIAFCSGAGAVVMLGAYVGKLIKNKRMPDPWTALTMWIMLGYSLVVNSLWS